MAHGLRRRKETTVRADAGATEASSRWAIRFVATAAGALMTMMQLGNPIPAFGCIVVAGQINALFVSRAPSRAAAGNLN